MQDFHQLTVWKKAHSLVLRVYTVSNDLPASENFGLVLNLRRSAVGIARSIAEGAARDSDAEFAIELKKARASGHDLNITCCSAVTSVSSLCPCVTNSTSRYWRSAR